MFPLYDRTRRAICIAAFFLFCALPTALLLAWGIARHLPWHVRSEADRLSSLLGLKVSLAGVRHLRPGVVHYEGLELSDPETGAKVLQCARLEAVWRQSAAAKGPSRQLLVLTALRPEAAVDQAAAIGRLVQRLLMQPSGWLDVDVRLSAADGTLRTAEGPTTLIDLQGSTETQPAGTLAQLSFRLPRAEKSDPVRIRVIRNRQAAPAVTGFELDTGGNALPCPLLAAGLAGIEQLGSRSRFRGSFWANETAEGWTGEMKGHLLDIDLERLVDVRFPHKLSGLAQLNLEIARFRQGRLQDANGALCAGPGMVSRSLIEAAAGRMGLASGLRANLSVSQIRYEQLSAAFSLDSRGLWLRGQCGSENSHAILVDRYTVLLGDPAFQPQPIAAVVQTLVPSGGLPVPVTPQTDWLLRHLPLPESPAAQAPDPALPSARTSEDRVER